MMTANEQKCVRWFEPVNKGRDEMRAAVDYLLGTGDVVGA